MRSVLSHRFTLYSSDNEPEREDEDGDGDEDREPAAE
jgi:hypothetical protein